MVEVQHLYYTYKLYALSVVYMYIQLYTVQELRTYIGLFVISHIYSQIAICNVPLQHTTNNAYCPVQCNTKYLCCTVGIVYINMYVMVKTGWSV